MSTIYTWTSDQHAQYGTRLIPTTEREATYVLDAIFDNETELDITIEEHTTDTAGYTDLVFGLFDLCGLKFSPRIRDIADQRLWRLPTTPTGTPAAGLLRHEIRPDRFLDRWDDLLRVSATIPNGHNSASLLVARLQASARQNEKHRRRVLAQLNKGGSLHALTPDDDGAGPGEVLAHDASGPSGVGEDNVDGAGESAAGDCLYVGGLGGPG